MIEDPNFLQVGRSRPEEVKWVLLDGTPSSGGTTNTKELLEEIDRVSACEGGSISSLSFRDPESFRVGGVHAYKELWRSLVSGLKNEAEVNEVNGFQEGSMFTPFFIPLKKFLEGKKYDTPMPPQKVFKNHSSRNKFTDFILRLKTGAVTVLGKAGEVDPPHIILPITILGTQRHRG